MNKTLSKLARIALVPVFVAIASILAWSQDAYAEDLTYDQVNQFTQEILEQEGMKFWGGDIVYTISYHVNEQNLLDIDEFVDAAMEHLSAASGVPVHKYDGTGTSPNFVIMSTDDMSLSIKLDSVQSFIGGRGRESFREGYDVMYNSFSSSGNGYGMTFRLALSDDGMIQKYFIIHNPITLSGEEAVASVIGGLVRGFIPSVSDSNALQPSIYNEGVLYFDELLPVPTIDSKFIGAYYKYRDDNEINKSGTESVSVELFDALKR